MDTQTVTEDYKPERDRPTLPTEEVPHWVPKEAIDLTHAFLDRLFPRIPVHPFMMLLLQLNKVWRKHEAMRLKDLKRRHKVTLAVKKRLRGYWKK